MRIALACAIILVVLAAASIFIGILSFAQTSALQREVTDIKQSNPTQLPPVSSVGSQSWTAPGPGLPSTSLGEEGQYYVDAITGIQFYKYPILNASFTSTGVSKIGGSKIRPHAAEWVQLGPGLALGGDLSGNTTHSTVEFVGGFTANYIATGAQKAHADPPNVARLDSLTFPYQPGPGSVRLHFPLPDTLTVESEANAGPITLDIHGEIMRNGLRVGNVYNTGPSGAINSLIRTGNSAGTDVKRTGITVSDDDELSGVFTLNATTAIHVAGIARGDTFWPTTGPISPGIVAMLGSNRHLEPTTIIFDQDGTVFVDALVIAGNPLVTPVQSSSTATVPFSIAVWNSTDGTHLGFIPGISINEFMALEGLNGIIINGLSLNVSGPAASVEGAITTFADDSGRILDSHSTARLSSNGLLTGLTGVVVDGVHRGDVFGPSDGNNVLPYEISVFSDSDPTGKHIIGSGAQFFPNGTLAGAKVLSAETIFLNGSSLNILVHNGTIAPPDTSTNRALSFWQGSTGRVLLSAINVTLTEQEELIGITAVHSRLFWDSETSLAVNMSGPSSSTPNSMCAFVGDSGRVIKSVGPVTVTDSGVISALEFLVSGVPRGNMSTEVSGIEHAVPVYNGDDSTTVKPSPVRISTNGTVTGASSIYADKIIINGTDVIATIQDGAVVGPDGAPPDSLVLHDGPTGKVTKPSTTITVDVLDNINGVRSIVVSESITVNGVEVGDLFGPTSSVQGSVLITQDTLGKTTVTSDLIYDIINKILMGVNRLESVSGSMTLAPANNNLQVQGSIDTDSISIGADVSSTGSATIALRQPTSRLRVYTPGATSDRDLNFQSNSFGTRIQWHGYNDATNTVVPAGRTYYSIGTIGDMWQLVSEFNSVPIVHISINRQTSSSITFPTGINSNSYSSSLDITVTSGGNIVLAPGPSSGVSFSNRPITSVASIETSTISTPASASLTLAPTGPSVLFSGKIAGNIGSIVIDATTAGTVLQIGSQTVQTATATPQAVDLGGSVGNSVGSGAQLKLKISNTGTAVSGIGYAATTQYYYVEAGHSHSYYAGNVKIAEMDETGVTVATNLRASTIGTESGNLNLLPEGPNVNLGSKQINTCGPITHDGNIGLKIKLLNGFPFSGYQIDISASQLNIRGGNGGSDRIVFLLATTEISRFTRQGLIFAGELSTPTANLTLNPAGPEVKFSNKEATELRSIKITSSESSDVIQVGDRTNTVISEPQAINLGGSQGDTIGAAAQLKLKIYDIGTAIAGIGYASLNMYYYVESTMRHAFYVGSTKAMEILSTGITVSLRVTSTVTTGIAIQLAGPGGGSFPPKIHYGNTIANLPGDPAQAKNVLYSIGSSDLYGSGVAGGALENFAPVTGTMRYWFVDSYSASNTPAASITATGITAKAYHEFHSQTFSTSGYSGVVRFYRTGKTVLVEYTITTTASMGGLPQLQESFNLPAAFLPASHTYFLALLKAEFQDPAVYYGSIELVSSPQVRLTFRPMVNSGFPFDSATFYTQTFNYISS